MYDSLKKIEMQGTVLVYKSWKLYNLDTNKKRRKLKKEYLTTGIRNENLNVTYFILKKLTFQILKQRKKIYQIYKVIKCTFNIKLFAHTKYPPQNTNNYNVELSTFINISLLQA